jgi:cytochrome c-type biogenesis protein CcmF
MKPGDTATISGYALTLEGYLPRTGPNYSETAVRFTVRRGGAIVAVVEPSKRLFTTRDTATTEAALATFGLSQLYVSLGDIGADGTATVRVYHKPLVTLIWLGALVMAAGGLMSLSDRRLRIGAPRPARRVQPAAAE